VFRIGCRFHEALRIVGLPTLLRIGPGWLARRSFLVLARDLEDDLPDVTSVPGVSWSSLEETHVPTLLAANPLLTGDEVRRRLHDWQACRLAWIGGVLAHYHWGATGRPYLPYLHRRVRLHPGDYLVAETFTAPAFRRRGLHTAASLRCLQEARALGFARLVGFIASWNTPSLIVAQRRMGRRVVGVAGSWALGPLRFGFTRGAVTRVGDLVALAAGPP
jgi:GNAT superfamily N-acetyltransferase